MNARPGLSQLGLSAGKKTRLHRILFQHGLRNGTALFLPYDQGLEHGPRVNIQPSAGCSQLGEGRTCLRAAADRVAGVSSRSVGDWQGDGRGVAGVVVEVLVRGGERGGGGERFAGAGVAGVAGVGAAGDLQP
jgi:hypothetical protein